MSVPAKTFEIDPLLHPVQVAKPLAVPDSRGEPESAHLPT